ncbi:MAG: Eco57I restriction-modification methylase domain-containing protein, partial [Acidobacteriaceae bacterium]
MQEEYPLQMLEHVDGLRRHVPLTATRTHKSAMGQFMTASSIARFMASLFTEGPYKECRLLDPGAGVGALSCAFLDRCATGELNFDSIHLCAYELDEKLRPSLAEALQQYQGHITIDVNILSGDFIEHATTLFQPTRGGFTHLILNPPYKKIKSDSLHRSMLRQAGIETVNLYSAFLALAISLAAPRGQIIAIVPRSFCNGPYYRPFRNFMLERSVIRRMHLFDSRSKAFKDDDVLQENLILCLERDGRPGNVRISTSTDDSFSDLRSYDYPATRIVFPDDPGRFIHVPTSPALNAVESSPAICHSLADIGLQVSTGPVVDFRVRRHTRNMPDAGTVPLLYPGHFSDAGTEWPKFDFKKPNAIRRNRETEKWLYPSGNYCVVRRFTSKEEKRRIVARVVSPETFAGAQMLGFENHLNVFHERKHGLSAEVARGLAVFLNMTAVDQQFRRFNGHTQVNATDLKMMKYPSLRTLRDLGEWAMQQKCLTQEMIDGRLDLFEL